MTGTLTSIPSAHRRHERGHDRREKSADCALPRLAGTDSWGKRPISDCLSYEEGARVRRKGYDEQEGDPLKAIVASS